MNAFSAIILAALGLDFGLRLAANLLNLRAMQMEPPPDLEGIYRQEDYRNSQKYNRTVTLFDLVVSAFSLAVLLSFWFAGGFGYLDRVIRPWDLGPVVSGLVYIGLLMIAYSLLSLPFSIYATFVIEERFGFNRATPRTFALDRVKAIALTALLGTALLSAIISLFEYSGDAAWLYVWAVVTVFTLAMQFVVPTWIMPLFNKFTPMQPGELKDAILKYAGSVNFPIKNIFVMDGSKRSTKSNAFFTGFGRNKRIALFDTLIEKHTTPELVAVLAHEVGHYKKKHITQGIVISILHTGVIFFLLSVFLDSSGLYWAFYVAEPSVYTGLLFFGLLYTPIEMVLSIALHIASRRNELQADRFAAETVEQPQSLVAALKKLSADNFSNLTPHPFYVFLNYSHPPLRQRVRVIQRYGTAEAAAKTDLS